MLNPKGKKWLWIFSSVISEKGKERKDEQRRKKREKEKYETGDGWIGESGKRKEKK